MSDLEELQMERFTVTHHGVPIGFVELPEGRLWADGPLESLPAAAPVCEVLAPIARQELATTLLMLPSEGEPAPKLPTRELRDAFRRAAALEFDLLDRRGMPVPAELVRVADPGGARLQVRVFFLHSNAPTPAVTHLPERGDGAFGPGRNA